MENTGVVEIQFHGGMEQRDRLRVMRIMIFRMIGKAMFIGSEELAASISWVKP